jgi:hypothetical protein
METLDQKPGAELVPGTSAVTDRRARKRLQDLRDFGSHAVAFFVINAFLIGGLGGHRCRILLAGVGVGRLGGWRGAPRLGNVRAAADHGGGHRQRVATQPPLTTLMWSASNAPGIRARRSRDRRHTD